jgi:hypothetical protein
MICARGMFFVRTNSPGASSLILKRA